MLTEFSVLMDVMTLTDVEVTTELVDRTGAVEEEMETGPSGLDAVCVTLMEVEMTTELVDRTGGTADELVNGLAELVALVAAGVTLIDVEVDKELEETIEGGATVESWGVGRRLGFGSDAGVLADAGRGGTIEPHIGLTDAEDITLCEALADVTVTFALLGATTLAELGEVPALAGLHEIVELCELAGPQGAAGLDGVPGAVGELVAKLETDSELKELEGLGGKVTRLGLTGTNSGLDDVPITLGEGKGVIDDAGAMDWLVEVVLGAIGELVGLGGKVTGLGLTGTTEGLDRTTFVVLEDVVDWDDKVNGVGVNAATARLEVVVGLDGKVIRLGVNAMAAGLEDAALAYELELALLGSFGAGGTTANGVPVLLVLGGDNVTTVTIAATEVDVCAKLDEFADTA
ncbi:hypothetical protein EJ08DRAFT_695458 [Tothia fuscella]|uniref:Uncharacterized protein n=1 Tax=Tothia fuscella TaxID=1048955 RepID=A0A9P4NVA8_9PEZI|nr:hypothetical protein EJ08DRAFT_695458 [Tothia fuscella]